MRVKQDLYDAMLKTKLGEKNKTSGYIHVIPKGDSSPLRPAAIPNELMPQEKPNIDLEKYFANRLGKTEKEKSKASVTMDESLNTNRMNQFVESVMNNLPKFRQFCLDMTKSQALYEKCRAKKDYTEIDKIYRFYTISELITDEKGLLVQVLKLYESLSQEQKNAFIDEIEPHTVTVNTH